MSFALEAADELHRTGWTTHAWCALWGVIEPLFGLGHRDTAALLLGGCESSGVARLAYQHIPDQLESVVDLPEGQHLATLRTLGSHLSLSDLLAIASG